MEQFRQIGEALGSLKALMVLQDDIQINRRQCCLLLNIFTSAFDTIAEEIKQNLKLDEKNTKWKPLEEPLKELYRVFKEGELYVRRCLDSKDWWGKAVVLHQNKDSIEFHIHNLVSYFPAVIEAIETAGEISGLDQDEMQKKRVMLFKKYDRSWHDQKLFQWRFGKQYLVSREICNQIETAVKEDGWLLVGAIKEKMKAGSLTKNEQRLGDLLQKKLNGQLLINGKLPPSSILLGAEDYQVRRRLGGGSQYKEIQWLGESFALRHFFEDIEPLNSEISVLLSLSHPNIVQYLCGFYDEEKKECFLVMELMSKDLYAYMKENSSSRRQVLFPLPIVVDIMLQVARGMEFLHSRKIYVGDLNPTNIFLKPRKSTEGYFHVKVSGFGLTYIENPSSRHSSSNQNAFDPCIWHAPEVLAEREQTGSPSTRKHSEKADVYSFGMLCFQLLTGKLPFEDGHLQGDQMAKNIRAGERPLFPSLSPKYLVNLTKKCWHTDPNYRPSFSSISRVLRYIKKYLVMNPVDGQLVMQSPPVDYSELEAGFLKRYPGEMNGGLASVSQIPFQMFVYRISEKERTSLSFRFKQSETSEAASNGWDENISVVEDPVVPASDARSISSDMKTVCFDLSSIYIENPDGKIPSDLRSVRSEPPDKKIMLRKKSSNVKVRKTPVKPKAPIPARTSPWNPPGQSPKVSREKPFSSSPLSPARRKASGQALSPEKL
ncbi:serine/threonine-protein kinase GIN4 [Ricinus communis]|uniref:Serine-threonine protein kinase, putative n=1 Tax=Ricinus communis TaxID=3988 RepID=B9RCP0_RICCO|nr:serine/threonine-protein kinase GIN4 [Ricinus communis]XP_015573883.1 serine/threonine-protein kinase GIN4 [Ricinus communis]XP_048229805.1 serine/threonine-protein kinase GIN4 [Ricinus communis]EEF51311.1 serine-threonine protein kinase, putative [Ricinus communis]|eukprot:XP_002509924.1 serine/threonine-protein kinase GIN4 [Ricinus communis]